MICLLFACSILITLLTQNKLGISICENASELDHLILSFMCEKGIWLVRWPDSHNSELGVMTCCRHALNVKFLQ